VEVDELARVLEAVRRSGRVPADELQHTNELSQTKLASALARLEDAGALLVRTDGEVEPVPDAPPDALRAAAEAEEMRRSFDRSRVDMMRAYAETGDCRRGFILSYFGEPFEPPCGNCDVCEAGGGERSDAGEPFDVGERVEHPQFGDGTVQQVGDGQVTVVFDRVGYKTLATDIVVGRGLLDDADP
jgi:ATP-dependent DNA helicase RecQ